MEDGRVKMETQVHYTVEFGIRMPNGFLFPLKYLDYKMPKTPQVGSLIVVPLTLFHLLLCNDNNNDDDEDLGVMGQVRKITGTGNNIIIHLSADISYKTV